MTTVLQETAIIKEGARVILNRNIDVNLGLGKLLCRNSNRSQMASS